MQKYSLTRVFRAFIMCVFCLSAPLPTPAENQNKYVPGTILLKTNWSQKYPFNKFLPKESGERVAAGCVNVALAQLMRYYKHPLKGYGIISHNWNRQFFSAPLGHLYNWEDIPEKISSMSPVHQIDEAASLIRELGIINKTQFKTASNGGSGAAINYKEIIRHLGYSTRVKSVSNDNPNFFRTLVDEIKRKRPVLLSISGHPMGHMAVVDGFKNTKNGRLFHLNMGWGGKENGFYDLRRTLKLKSAEEENFFASDYRFSNKLRIFYNFVPCRKDDCHINLEKGDKIASRRISGYFDKAKDTDVYRGIYLQGETIIRGNLGFANLGFYIKIYDSKGRELISTSPKSKEFQIYLKPERYDIEVSQCDAENGQINCFKYSPEFAEYEININSGRISLDMKNRIDEANNAIFINNRFPDLILDYENERKIRIDAFAASGKTIDIKVESSDRSVLKAEIKGNQLTLTPVNPERDSTAKVVVTALSVENEAEKEFNVLFNPKTIFFGQEFEIGGKFESQTAVSRKKVILEGVCFIAGNNGHKNQAFFIGIKNAGGTMEILPSSAPFSSYFERGWYYIESSPQKRTVIEKGNKKEIRTSSFKYKENFGTVYNVNVVCPDFRDGIALLKYDNRDLPPTIESKLPDRIVKRDFKRLEIPIKTDDKDGETAELEAYIDHGTLKGKIVDGVLILEGDRLEKNSSAEITVTAKSNNLESKKSFKLFFASDNFPFGEEFELTGSFKGQKDAGLFKVVLSGTCSVSGYNGYANQAFYIQVLKRNRTPFLQMTNQPFKYNFPAGIYYVRTSLTGNSGSYYRFMPQKNDKYKISFLCPSMKSLSDDIKKALERNK